jgi:hypothetical protein
MKNIKKVFVFLDFGNTRLKVGTLVVEKKQVYSQFEPSFLGDKYEISSFNIPKAEKIIDEVQTSLSN